MKSAAIWLAVTATSVSAIPISPRDSTTYDFIVVGSGAGGLTVADKLSESGKSVLLIERGPPSSGRWGGQEKPDWLQGTNLTFYDVPGLDNEIYSGNFSSGIYCPDVQGGIAGCVLGGSTAINAGLWWRPAAIDWDYQFPAGWHSGDMANATERVFSRIPGTSVPSQDGKLYQQQGADVLENALGAAGWTQNVANDDPDAKNRTFTNTTFMYEHGERGGPMATYLVTASARTNFALWTNTMVERVIRNGSQIVGVEVKSAGDGGHDGTVSLSGAAGGVVLSAGAFGSPKILLRSGIGPQDMLEVVQNSSDGANLIAQDQWIGLPVGHNLVDNLNTDVVISHPDVDTYDFTAAYNSPSPSDSAAYLANRTGILTQSAPLLNPMFWESTVGSDGYYRQLQWTARVSSSLGIQDDGHAMTLSNYLGLGQVSRGRTTIDTNLNMVVSTSPSISQNVDDRAAIVKGLDDLRAALSNVTGLSFLSPTADVAAGDYVDSTTHAPVNHWLGSCKMGEDDGRQGGTAVVDIDTKVYGTDNLFVVDGSIFPGLTTANPSAYIVIAAERAAERILALQ
ncbi:hypothetical protein MBLNU459_g4350t2 [Dothideomycetes sp. NU459]